MKYDNLLPYDIFNEALASCETNANNKLKNIYHKGQEKAWDGRELISNLKQKYGKIELDTEKKEALKHILSSILWGEFAAWKISADLALQIDSMEAKMAVTSQAHDEARHFYVLYEYFKILNMAPIQLNKEVERVLAGTLNAKTIEKKLLGMHLMIEPMALTLFQSLRKKNIDPFLSELLSYYEVDEARHVALGVLYLPKKIKSLTLVEAANLWIWQFSEFWNQLKMIVSLKPYFDILEIDPRKVIELGKEKQIKANEMLINELGFSSAMQGIFIKLLELKIEWSFSANKKANFINNAKKIIFNA